jgi:hypothetical protein
MLSDAAPNADFSEHFADSLAQDATSVRRFREEISGCSCA